MWQNFKYYDYVIKNNSACGSREILIHWLNATYREDGALKSRVTSLFRDHVDYQISVQEEFNIESKYKARIVKIKSAKITAKKCGLSSVTRMPY